MGMLTIILGTTLNLQMLSSELGLLIESVIINLLTMGLSDVCQN